MSLSSPQLTTDAESDGKKSGLMICMVLKRSRSSARFPGVRYGRRLRRFVANSEIRIRILILRDIKNVVRKFY